MGTAYDLYQRLKTRSGDEEALYVPEPTPEEAAPSFLSRAATLPLDAALLGLSGLKRIDDATRVAVGALLGQNSGWDLLRPMEQIHVPSGRELIGLSPGTKGTFEAGDVPGFLTEAALSPVNLISFGGLTPAAKAAQRAASLANRVRVAEAGGNVAAEEIRKLAEQGLTAATVRAFPRNVAEQTTQGLRQGFGLRVPFGGEPVPISLFGGRISRPLLQAEGALGGAIKAGLGRVAEPLAKHLRPSGRLGPASFEGLEGLAERLGERPELVYNEAVSQARGEQAIGRWGAEQLRRTAGGQMERFARAEPMAAPSALAGINALTEPLREQLAGHFDEKIGAAVAAGNEARARGLAIAKTKQLRQLARPEVTEPLAATHALTGLAIEKGESVGKIQAEIAARGAATTAAAERRIALARQAEASIRLGAGAMPSGLGGGFVSPEAETTIRELWSKTARLNDAAARKTAEQAVRLKVQQRAGQIVLENLPEPIQHEAERISTAMGLSLAAEQRAGVRVKSLGDFLLGYLPRRTAAGFGDWANRLPEGDPFRAAYREWKTTGRFTLERSPELKGLAAPVINELARARGFVGDLLELNPAEAAARRLLEGAKARGGASLSTGALTLFAMPKDLAGEGARSVASLLHELKLGRIGSTKIEGPGLGEIVKELAGTQFEDAYIPRAVAEALTRTHAALTDSKQLAGILGAVQKINAVYRLGVTQFFPGFHVRNLTSDAFMAALAGMRSPATIGEALRLQWRVHNRLLSEAGQTVGGRLASDAEMETFRGAIEHAALGHGVHAESAGMLDAAVTPGWAARVGQRLGGLLGNRAGELGGTLGAKLTGGFNRAAGLALQLGTAREDTGKLALYLWARKQGQTAAEAGRLVQKYLFDYSDLSVLEKAPLFGPRSLAFFYTYTRKAIPLMVDEILLQPRRLRMLGYATGQLGSRAEGRENLPAYLRERMPIGLGRDTAGNERYTSLGLPYEMLTQFSSEGQGPMRSAQRILGQAAPLPRYLLEAIFQRDLGSGKPGLRTGPLSELALKQLPPNWQRELRPLAALEPLLPTSRFTGAVSTLLDTAGVGPRERTGLETLAQLGLGASLLKVQRGKGELRTRLDRIERALHNYEDSSMGDTPRAKELRSLRGRLRRDLSLLNLQTAPR